MHLHPLLSLGLFGLLATAAPASATGSHVAHPHAVAASGAVGPSGYASGSTARPTAIGYRFVKGKVHYPRSLRLALTDATSDAIHPGNNATYKLGFTAKMIQFIIGTDHGIWELSTAFQDVTSNVNGLPVQNSIPPTWDPGRKQVHEYVLGVDPYGRCFCSQLPPIIYADGPRWFSLSRLIGYLHPALATSKAALATNWTTVLSPPLALTAKRSQNLDLVSHLQPIAGGHWSVASALSKTFRVTMSPAQFASEEGGAQVWDPSTLPGSGPVTVTESVSISSTLTLGKLDGVDLWQAKGSKVKGATNLCTPCTGYTKPLDGIETLTLSFSRGGTQFFGHSSTAHLTMDIGS